MTDFYCPRCGTKNDVEQRIPGRYDTELGWPIYETRYVCPNKRMWFDGHTRTRWEGRRVNPRSWNPDGPWAIGGSPE